MNSQKIKKGLQYIPELIIFLIALYWLLDGFPSHINSAMLIIMGFILILVIRKSKILAVFLSVVLGIGSLYMILAVISEYREFPPGDADGTKLLLTGCSIFIGCLLMAIFLPIKYIHKNNKPHA